MPPLNILIKPASSRCNLNCKYCFYHADAKKRKISDYGMMDLITLENIVRKAFDEAEYFVSFLFQGGEPLLIGINFYKEFIKYIEKYNKKKIKVNKVIQTNGILIDEKWSDFFKGNDFLLGVSLDGDEVINDKNRIDKNLEGSYKDIIKAINILQKKKIDFNVLTVITNENAIKAKYIYNFFRKKKISYMQFIPCIDNDNESFLDENLYLEFLKDLFDEWYEEVNEKEWVSIRYFEDIIRMILNNPNLSCDLKGVCSIQNVIEADGTIFPCDFYADDKHILGNINEEKFSNIKKNKKALKFVGDSKEIRLECKLCEYYKICMGGCMRYSINDSNKYIYCRIKKDFFGYTIKRFLKLAQRLNKN